MNINRRNVIKACAVLPLLVKVGFLTNVQAATWNKGAFEATSMDGLLKALGASAPTASGDISIVAPEIAENGAVVRVVVESKLAKTESVAVLVEKNPNMLAGDFHFVEGTEPFIGVNVKMAQTSNITVLAKADGKWFSTTKEVKVTLGGCGG